MGCENYHIYLMALLDGEVSEAEREDIETHLGSCYHCHEEYENYRHIHELTCSAMPAAPESFTWDTYYEGVCHKMEHKANWGAWLAVSLLLATAGALILFGLHQNVLTVVAAAIAFATSAAIAFIGYLCSCVAGKPRTTDTLAADTGA